MYVVLLGPPGSGKGTQGNLLSQRIGIPHLSTGDLFREILANPNHRLYKDIQVIKDGKLVPDEITNRVIKASLKDPKYKKGIIFDGYPRTICQAKALKKALGSMGKKLNAVIDINVTQDVLLGRLLGRRSCPNCKSIFHKDQGYTKCPNCDIPLVKRNDDNRETIMERFHEYHFKTAPLRDFYRNSDLDYIEITVSDSATPATSVHQEVMGQLNRMEIASL